jgi:transposase
MATEQYKVIAGIDTHADTHHVALVTDYGKRLGDRKFLAVGTGSYGAELTRILAGQGFTLREVNRPNRAERRLHGKSDPLDAYQAAESVLAERGTSTPKTRDGYVEALRVLRTARSSAMKARTALLNQISAVLTSATEEVRAKCRGLKSEARAKAMAASRPTGDPADPVVATLLTLKRRGARHRFLSEEITETDDELAVIVSTYAPEILEVNGVGAVVASQRLVTFGDNPERMGSEAAFAALAGVAPVPASSGQTNRHRLSRGGDRQANSALHRIVLVRMSKDARTREYVAKRSEDGLGKKEIIRCLKRYVAREAFRVMKSPRRVPPRLRGALRCGQPGNTHGKSS